MKILKDRRRRRIFLLVIIIILALILVAFLRRNSSSTSFNSDKGASAVAWGGISFFTDLFSKLTQPASKPVVPGSYKVGYETSQFAYATKSGAWRSLNMALWYPASGVEQAYTYDKKKPGPIVGSVVLNGEPNQSEAPYPVVIFAHGYLGCGTQSVFITQYLASHGYIVAAVDFDDAFACLISGGTGASALGKGGETGIAKILNPMKEFQQRPEDMEALINEIVRQNNDANSALFGLVDTNAIAISGHSLGGWTSHIVAGVSPQDLQFLKDSRVKAALFFDPYMKDLKQSYFQSELDIPVMYIIAEANLVPVIMSLPVRESGYVFSDPDKYLLGIEDTDHFDFTDEICSRNDAEVIMKCQTKVPAASIMLRYSLNFLDAYLKNDAKAKKELLGSPEKNLFIKESQLSY